MATSAPFESPRHRALRGAVNPPPGRERRTAAPVKGPVAAHPRQVVAEALQAEEDAADPRYGSTVTPFQKAT